MGFKMSTLDPVSFPARPPLIFEGDGDEDDMALMVGTHVPKYDGPVFRLRDLNGVQIASSDSAAAIVDFGIAVHTPLEIWYHGVRVATTNRKAGENTRARAVRILRELLPAVMQRNEDIEAYKQRVLVLAEEYAR